MATHHRYTGREKYRVVFTAVFIFLLVWIHPARGETTGIFYQPQNRDQSISTNEWQSLFSQTDRYNLNEIVAQWNQYGTSDFDGPDGWLARVLDEAIRAEKSIWLGLYSDPDYFRQIHNSDLAAQRSYLESYLDQVRQNFQRWESWMAVRDESVRGVYLPAELTDFNFSSASQRQMLEEVLTGYLPDFSPYTVMVSMFWANQIPLSEFTAWVDSLRALGLVVLIQDDQGANINQLPDGSDPFASLECGYDLIVEIFEQVSPFPDFEAQRLSNRDFRQRLKLRECHLNYLFSLRYLPVRKNPLAL